eukprot:4925730-Prymnesium_polylepis.1
MVVAATVLAAVVATAVAVLGIMATAVTSNPSAPVQRQRFLDDGNATDFVRRVALRRTPVVLTQSPTASWPALQSWTPEYLASKLTTLPLVYGLPHRKYVYHEPSREMGAKMGLRVPNPHEVRTNVSAREFFGSSRSEPLYLADKLWRCGLAAPSLINSFFGAVCLSLTPSLARHITTRRPPYSAELTRDAEPRAFLSGTADLPELNGQDAIIWAGDEGTTAQPHYDSTHTMFAQ